MGTWQPVGAPCPCDACAGRDTDPDDPPEHPPEHPPDDGAQRPAPAPVSDPWNPPGPHARRDDPGTSHAAARRLSPKRTTLRRLLTAFDTYGPMTAEEAATICGYTARDGAWRRVSDLARLGYIADTGRTQPGTSGRAQQVRAITDRGRAALTDGARS